MLNNSRYFFILCFSTSRKKNLYFLKQLITFLTDFSKDFFLENQQLIAKCRWKQWREISTHVTTFSYIVWFKKESIDYIIFLLYCKKITTCLGLFENIFWHNTIYLFFWRFFFSNQTTQCTPLQCAQKLAMGRVPKNLVFSYMYVQR